MVYPFQVSLKGSERRFPAFSVCYLVPKTQLRLQATQANSFHLKGSGGLVWAEQGVMSLSPPARVLGLDLE